MDRPIRWYDYLSINIYFLALTTLSQTNGLVMPLLVQQFVGEEAKGSYYGMVRLWTLMVALLIQAIMGMLSDRSRLRWGRRRPFIFTGSVLDLVFLGLVGFSAGMGGMSGFWFMFSVSILLSFSSNIAQSAQQGLIPDLVPEHNRGRFSGIKAVLEVPLPLILVSFTVARLISAGHMWWGILAAMGVLVIATLLTMLAPEKPLIEALPPIRWAPFLRLVLMTGVFTAIILGCGAAIRLLGNFLGAVDSIPASMLLMGLAGLVAMAIAIAIGVWISIRISLGEADAGKNPSFTWWVINRLAFLVPAFNLSTFAVYFMQARLGYVREKAAGPAANLMMVVGVFILLSALPSGWLADRFGRKQLVGISGFLGAIGTAIAIATTSMTVIYVGGFLIGIATGLFFTANWALGTDIVPRGEAGRYLGISNLAGAGAGAVGAYIGGPIADFFTVHVPQIPGLGYLLLFAIFGVLFLLSVAALRGVGLKQASSSSVPQPVQA